MELKDILRNMKQKDTTILHAVIDFQHLQPIRSLRRDSRKSGAQVKQGTDSMKVQTDSVGGVLAIKNK